MNRLYIAVLILLIIAGGFYYLSQPKSNQTQIPNVQPTSAPITSGSTTQAQVKTFTVEAQNYSFNPSEIRVKKGDTVKIDFKNLNGFHDFVLDEFNAKIDPIQGGQSSTVQFVANKTGTFEYYCSVDGHRQMGMVGKLIVE